MNPTLKKLSSLAFVAIMLLSAIPIVSAGLPPSVPPTPPAVYLTPTTVDPGSLGIGLGDRFNITVNGITSDTSTGWQFWMRYNSAHLNVTGAWYARGTTSEMFEGLVTFPVSPSFNYAFNGTHGEIQFGEAAGIGVSKPPGGPWELAFVEFEILGVPGKGETIYSMIGITEGAAAGQTYLLGPSAAVKYTTAYDAEFEYIWTTPPGPVLTFDPPTRMFDEFTAWNGVTFTEDIVLEDLDGLWGLTNMSFSFTFDILELNIVDITMNTADWNVAATFDNTTTPGQVDFVVITNQALGGDILVATVTFVIIDQNVYPDPDDVVALTFTGVEIWDHTLLIDPTAVIDGEITIMAFKSFANPWMEVVPEDTVVGDGEFVKHTTFCIEVTVNRVHYAARLVGVEFRLGYDDTLLEVVSVTEGPYLGGYAPFGTFFASYVEPNFYGPHVLVGNLILPNGTGDWNPPFPGAEPGDPGENGTIATICFKIIEQLPEPDFLEGTFDLFQIRMVDPDASLIDVDFGAVVNGTYTCLGFPWQGRFLDIYGGADNAGYGSIPFPDPYGGQGLNMPMDLVIPQSEVTLFGDVLYNYWPVQSKEVNFEVEGPYEHLFNETSQEWYYAPMQTYHILLKETVISNTDGVAEISFRMPWPCENPWGTMLGVYKVTGTVNIADVVVTDTLYFYYDYMVHIFDVTTDKFYYKHDECVKITVEYGSHAMQTYPALFAAAIKDELNVVIGLDLLETTVGGAEFCTFANGSIELEICIPKWAFVGYADIIVNVYDMDPTIGGFAWAYPFVGDDFIYILPN
jgi:hypothetical protein